MKYVQKIKLNNNEKTRKKKFTNVGIATSLVSLLLLITPFVKFFRTALPDGEPIYLSPIAVFGLVYDSIAVSNGAAIISLILFILWGIYIGFLVIKLLKIFFNYSGSEKKFCKNIRKICLLNTIACGSYFGLGLLFDLMNRALGGLSAPTINFVPFILVLIIDIRFAIYLGAISDENLFDADEPETKKKIGGLKARKIELLIFATILFVLTILAFCSKIIEVKFISSNSSLNELEFILNGLDLLKDYETLGKANQIIAFLIFVAMVIVGVFYYLTIVSCFSKSRTFFKFAIYSVIVSIVCCFIIGMFGKYYQMLQEINAETLLVWVEHKINEYIPGKIDLSTFKQEFLKSYKVISDSFYYFLGTLVVMGIVICRKPYSIGMQLQRELYQEYDGINADVDHAEITVTSLDSEESTNSNTTFFDEEEKQLIDENPCPAFTEIDGMIPEFNSELEFKKQSIFEDATLPKIVNYIVQYARDSRLHLFYTVEDIATFIAGLGTTKLTILQGMSGTGKTSLPKIFSEALMSKCNIIEVESSWRDKNELLGYYNEFSKIYTPKKFTQALYEASLNPEIITFIVLDEMNLSRIEYYFSDFLSLMENEPDKREIKLLNINLFETKNGQKNPYKGLKKGHTIKVPSNVWFIGTANRDESTFEISDKVYDRAHTMNFNKRAQKVKCFNDPVPQQFISADKFNELLEDAKKTIDFTIEDYPVIAEVEKLLNPYNISFGNRIAMQIESFVAIYCACFSATDEVIHEAVERILLSKVVSKLELKSIEDKDELAAAFDELNLHKCSEFISKLNED